MAAHWGEEGESLFKRLEESWTNRAGNTWGFEKYGSYREKDLSIKALDKIIDESQVSGLTLKYPGLMQIRRQLLLLLKEQSAEVHSLYRRAEGELDSNPWSDDQVTSKKLGGTSGTES